MSNDGHAAGRQHLIPTRMIEMVMSIDRKFYRLLCLLLDLADQLLHRDGRKERINDKDTAVADNESGIAGSQAPGLGSRGENASGNLDQLEVVFSFKVKAGRGGDCGE
jgi:hypothetical protein